MTLLRGINEPACWNCRGKGKSKPWLCVVRLDRTDSRLMTDFLFLFLFSYISKSQVLAKGSCSLVHSFMSLADRQQVLEQAISTWTYACKLRVSGSDQPDSQSSNRASPTCSMFIWDMQMDTWGSYDVTSNKPGRIACVVYMYGYYCLPYVECYSRYQNWGGPQRIGIPVD